MSTLSIIAKYLRQKKGLSRKETYDELDKFMQDNYKNYVPALWENRLERLSNNATKYKIREINQIFITQNELDAIERLKNIKYKKLMFTMLCFAKMYNILSECNNNWIYVEINEIYNTANVKVRYSKDKLYILHELKELGMISLSKKNDNLNFRINIVDSNTDSPIALKICTLNNLGYEYMNYIGSGKFVRCSNCEKLILIKNKMDFSTKYCNDCKSILDSTRKHEWYKNIKK